MLGSRVTGGVVATLQVLRYLVGSGRKPCIATLLGPNRHGATRHMLATRVPFNEVRNIQPQEAATCTNRASASGSLETHPTPSVDFAINGTGSIEIITGPMFAGKTTALLKRVSEYEAGGLLVAVVKSAKDTRYGASEVVSHNGERKHCFAVNTLQEFRQRVGDRFLAYEVIAIDEGQFFPDLLEFCLAAADCHHKKIIVAGLDGDYKRRKFGQVLELLPVSDTVTKLAARCAYCDSKALFSLRIVADERQEVVGGADKYAPVCRHHYISLSNVCSPPDTDSDTEARNEDVVECG